MKRAIIIIAAAVAVLTQGAANASSFLIVDEDFGGASDPLSYWYQDPDVSQDSFGWDDANDNMWGEARRGQGGVGLEVGTAERAYISFSTAGYGDADEYLEYTEDFDFSFDFNFSSFAPGSGEPLMLGFWYSPADAEADRSDHFTWWANRQHFIGAQITDEGNTVYLLFLFSNSGAWSNRTIADELTGAASLSTGVNYRIEGHYRYDGTTYGQLFGRLVNLDTSDTIGEVVQETITQDEPDIYSVAYANFNADTANRRFIKLSQFGVGNSTAGTTSNPGPQFTSDNWTLAVYDPVILTSLEVRPPVNAVYVGGSAKLFCDGYDGGGARYDVSEWVDWSSQDPATVSIDELNRAAVGSAQGSTNIKATFGALESPLVPFDVLPPRTPHLTSFGLNVLLQWRDLPILKTGTEAGMASSYNRAFSIYGTTGDNNWYDEYGYRLTTDVDPVTVRELTGRPGLITRTWMPWLPGPEFKLKFYFDGEVTPRLDTNTLEWYDAGVPGHGAIEEPFAGNGQGSGGAWCYSPLYFETGLKIESNNRQGLLNFYQMNYLLLPIGTTVETYTATQSSPQWADRNLTAETIYAVGDNPGPVGPNIIHTSGSLAPGETLVLAYLGSDQHGIITRLQIDLDAPTDVQLAGAKLKVYYGRSTQPSIDVSVGEFFGAGRDRIDYNSVSLGTNHQNGYYSYLPMPYRHGVRIEIVNNSAETLDVTGADVEYEPQQIDETYAYLHARYSQDQLAAGEDRMYEVLSVPDGKGHYLGCLLTVTPESSEYGYLEGNDRIIVDSGAKQTLYGTGLEDAFNGGYYYKLPYDTPFAGLLKKATGITTQYRHRIIDFVPFEESIIVEYQGVDSWGKEFARLYESTAYWYQFLIEPPDLVVSRGTENMYHLSWAEAGSYDLEFDTSPEFDSPVVVDVTGLTEYDYYTEKIQGLFRLKTRFTP